MVVEVYCLLFVPELRETNEIIKLPLYVFFKIEFLHQGLNFIVVDFHEILDFLESFFDFFEFSGWI